MTTNYQRCKAITTKGKQCKLPAREDSDYCHIHRVSENQLGGNSQRIINNPFIAYKKLQDVLVYRGLRFPVQQYLYRFHSVEKVTGFLFYIISFLLSTLSFWLLFFAPTNLTSQDAVITSALISLAQNGFTIAFTGVLIFITRIPIKTQTRSHQNHLQSLQSRKFSRLLRITLVLPVIIGSIFGDVCSMWAGIMLAESATGVDDFSFLETYDSLSNFAPSLIGIALISVIFLMIFSGISAIRQSSVPGYRWEKIIRFLNALGGPFFGVILTFYMFLVTNSAYPFFSALLLISAMQQIILIAVFFLMSFFLSTATTVLMALPGLVQLRFTLLGISFLAATIPFLNSDSWQLVSRIGFLQILYVAFLIYLIPIGMLLYEQRKLFEEEWKRIWTENPTISVNEALSACNVVGLETELFGSLIDSSIDQIDTINDQNRLKIKNILKGGILLMMLPLLVFLFSWIFFMLLIGDDLLQKWTEGYFDVTSSSSFWDFADNWEGLRIKAALLLSTLSTTSTLGSLLAAKEDLRDLIRNSFLSDIELDRKLLVLFHMFHSIHSPEGLSFDGVDIQSQNTTPS